MQRPPNIPNRKLPTPVKSDPQQTQVVLLIKQGLALHQQNKLPEAEAIYKQILRIQPNNFSALQLIGTMYTQTKNHSQAINFLTKAIKINPQFAPCYNNLGLALQELNRLDEALASYDKAITIKPDYADAHYNRGFALHEIKRWYEALDSYDKAISIKPDYAEAYSNRGVALQELKRLDEALASYDKAISIKPDYADAHSNRGFALQELKRLDEALISYDKAISIKPDYAEAYYNRGYVLQELKHLDEALTSYDKAISIKPDYVEANWNKSLGLLLDGQFAQGWQEYECRWKKEDISKTAGIRNFPQPIWLGAESLKDKTILLYAEQGLGDTIQFSRYVPLIAELGAKVILEVQSPLVKLLKNLEGVNQIAARGGTISEFDYQCPLLSLPLAFKTELNTIPPASKYMISDNKNNLNWQIKLGEKSKPRIGIVWSGSTEHKNDHNRSITLSQLIPYLPSNMEYVCLQKELRGIDKEALEKNPHIQFYGDDLEDFTDTAALCDLMDVVISVDTSVAHLAGTLGKQTWVLLPYSPDWRWMLDRDDSPWYPSVKLYRQENNGNWNGVLEKLNRDLEKIH
jgi:hypothetical protein